MEKQIRFLRISHVKDITGLSKSYIYQLVSAGKFPKPVNIVPGGKSVGWVEHEVQEWITSRMDART